MGSPNQGGTADLNLSGEFGKYRLTCAGCKSAENAGRTLRLGNSQARATAVMLPPSSRARSADGNAGTLAFPYPYVEALGARWPCAEATVKGGSKPL